MSLEGLTGLVDRITAWADRLQRNHGVLGFPYAVIKKYGDDAGGRQAALITYYGFLSIFPLLLLGVAILSRVLADHPDLRQRLITAIVPEALQSTVEHSLATLPTSTIPFAVGLIGLLFSGTGVVFSAYQTLNHVAAVRYRLRAGFFSRYVRVLVVLATLLLGALATGALTVVATALPGQPGLERVAAVLGFCVGRLCRAAVWGQVAAGAAGPDQGPVAGSDPGCGGGDGRPQCRAAVAGQAGGQGRPRLRQLCHRGRHVRAVYLVGQALVYAAEVAAVRYARLWPRALDVDHPTAADVRALALLAREQERIPAARVELHLATGDSPPPWFPARR